MELEIGGKMKELKFNMRFVRKLDEFYKIEQDGFEMGFGVNMAINALNMRSLSDLAKVIRSSVEGASNVLDVDKAIEQYAEENGTLEPLFAGISEEMGKSALLKATVEKFKTLGKE